MDVKGRGIFPAPAPSLGEVVVPFTTVGDEIEATFIKRDGGNKIGKLTKVVSPSPDRVVAPCPHAGVCGGCLWQHMEYGAQTKLKEQKINLAFEQAGHAERIATFTPSSVTLHYRNRMDYVIGWKNEIGLKEYGTWNHYLDLQTCLLLDDETPVILQTVRDLMKDLELPAWDAKKFTGLMRYVVIRLGRFTKERLITLVVKDASAITAEQRAEITKRLQPFCTTLLLGENPLQTDISICASFEALIGQPFLTEKINEITYQIHPNSFFQTNSVMAQTLQTKVLDLALAPLSGKPVKQLLDLYCGLGFFGIAAAKRGVEVAGFEIDAGAIELAKTNATLNNVTDHCTFTAGPAEDLSWKDIPADTIILDPPRAGMHPKALEAVLEKAPERIVYVSCNFHRLVLELKTLKEKYKVVSVEALDLFPQTPHVEVIVVLEKK